MCTPVCSIATSVPVPSAPGGLISSPSSCEHLNPPALPSNVSLQSNVFSPTFCLDVPFFLMPVAQPLLLPSPHATTPLLPGLLCSAPHALFPGPTVARPQLLLLLGSVHFPPCLGKSQQVRLPQLMLWLHLDSDSDHFLLYFMQCIYHRDRSLCARSLCSFQTKIQDLLF